MKKFSIRISVLVISFIFLLLSCNRNETFVLEGEIDSKYDGQQIMLFTFKHDTIRSVDTTVVHNGAFRFNGKEYLDDYSMLSIGNYPDPVLAYELLLEKGVINLSFKDNRIQGTPLNDLQQSYSDSTKLLFKNLNRSSEGAIDMDEKFDRFMTYKLNFLRRNIHNIVGLNGITESLNDCTQYGDSILAIIDTYADKRLINHPWVNRSRERMAEYKRDQIKLDGSVGSLYTDFELRTPEGEAKKISDYVGKSKYLFIEFWASWCGPCIADVPHVKTAYTEYNKKGLNVISISLDDNEQSWLNALKKIDAPWVHLSNLEGIPSNITKAYTITGIPHSLLLDQNGIILFAGISGQVLSDILKQESLK